ncbi:MAG: hypothetical protein A2W25_06520 [candidate division Zixibacteria bacterium RBG_16_53_22]|nr:MAG: hypothetical protein A2W25_06520 [candidate division Zixibacteria bacterium RBG_16_53_22]
MRRFTLVAICFWLLFAAISAGAGVTLGLGLDYTPIVNLQYVNNPDLDYEIVDNIAWQGRAFYDFENGFRAGGIFDYLRKSSGEGGFRSIELSQWGIGLVGEYGYEITETGNTILVGGMETGYGELSDKTNSPTVTAGSIWIGGLAGLRFHVTHNFWCELAYRFIWLEFEINSPNLKKYLFSGSSLRLTLEYPLLSNRKNDTDKGDTDE